MATISTKPKLLFLFFFFFVILISLFVACQCDKEENNNPYLFESHRFRPRLRSKYGEFRVLDKFTQLPQGIQDYRVGVLELQPLSFMIPHHFDAQLLLFVLTGKGTISIVEEDDKSSFKLEHGDVLTVSPGSTIYFTNTHNKENFSVYLQAKALNVPFQFQEFFSGGGENPETFYRAFSSDILETAFNTPRDRLKRLFGQQKQGIIIKASKEQIKEISKHASHSAKEKKGERRGPFNLLKERPLFSNRFGQFFEATPERFQQLRPLDAAVGFMSIKQGGMALPQYNTRATWLVMVVEGKGLFEMACPHLGSQTHRQGHYQKVRGCLSVGDVFVVPAGHPLTIVTSGGSNLRMVGFGFNAHNNKLNFLAGHESIWRNVEREAKELAFNMPAREVEEILHNQQQSYFAAANL